MHGKALIDSFPCSKFSTFHCLKNKDFRIYCLVQPGCNLCFLSHLLLIFISSNSQGTCSPSFLSTPLLSAFLAYSLLDPFVLVILPPSILHFCLQKSAHVSKPSSNATSFIRPLCAQSRSTLGDPMDCSPPGSSVHRIFQARILEWVAISSSRGSSQLTDQACVSCSSCLGRQILYHLCHLGNPNLHRDSHTITNCNPSFFKYLLPFIGNLLVLKANKVK